MLTRRDLFAATAALAATAEHAQAASAKNMELGAFSISLKVKDLKASRQFYEKFGFKAFAGDASRNWLILKNGDHVIGLFQGMFDKNILTFNPGWDQSAQKLARLSHSVADLTVFGTGSALPAMLAFRKTSG
jgi:hypothetical protein